jgi:DNA (cytosine-5)-methyltransferase 1
MKLRYLSLFSGIEAASVAWTSLGWECVAVAEVEPFPCAVLKHHYPDVPNLGDVSKITKEQIEALGHIDIVIAGWPCQDLSVAGNRKGLTNADGTLTRSGLFYTAVTIAGWAKARWTIGENVPGLFSSNEGRDFATVVGELAGIQLDVPGDGWRTAGVALGPRGLVEWATLDAQYCRVDTHPRAVPQRRRRVFFVRDTGDWASRPPLFLVPESLRGNPPPIRGQREGTTRGFECGPQGGSFTDLCPTLDRRCKDGPIRNQLGVGIAHETAHTLRAAHDSSEDGTGRGTPIIVADVASTLNAHYGEKQGLENQHVNQGCPLFVTTLAFSSKDDGGDATENCSPTLRAGKHDKSHANAGVMPAIATFQQSSMAGKGTIGYDDSGVAKPAKTQVDGQMIQNGTEVRRLTPEECEALQAFPRGYTRIPWRGKPAGQCPDGPRYAALGNSMATNVIRWIGQRLERIIKP